jgi:DNA modification methylase
MPQLTEAEKQQLCALIQAGERLPEKWRTRLFRRSPAPAVGKEYRLVYDGMMKREDVLAKTTPAPWQLVRRFCESNPHPGGWRNLLVWGDNLLALRELLADQQGPNRCGTRGKIRLIAIDPPFATRQDFMKDKEKAYRDKVLGAQFIEFLRRRLILLRELLADDGSIYVHLDTKKGHYIKAIMDEVFGEENFINQIIWKRLSAHNDAVKYGPIHDTIFFYSKGDRYTWNKQFAGVSQEYINQFFDQVDPANGRRYARGDLTARGTRRGETGKLWRGIDPNGMGNHWKVPPTELDRLDALGKIHWPAKEGGMPRLKRYADELEGVQLQDLWLDIKLMHNLSQERLNYPTQKPEQLLDRIIRASSNPNDIVLDCFAGSGTTAAVAEKLGRRWITMDCGKLAIYTAQKRLFSLTTTIGSPKKDDRTEPARVDDWAEHLKNAPGVLLLTEKARKGECEVTLELLHDLAALVKKHDLLKKGAALSLVCPEDKLRVPANRLAEPEDGPGAKSLQVEGVEFRISFIAPKDKPEKEKPLKAKAFALYRAGVYDMEAVKAMPWDDYRPFVLKLFGVSERPTQRYGWTLDGCIGTDAAMVWNYPDQKKLTLDYGYVDDLHRGLRGEKGQRFYVIAPVVAMAFAEDELVRGGTTYVFLKVPLSVLRRLIEAKEPAAFKQPTKEEDVNEVIDAAGFDFISQPQVTWTATKAKTGLLPEYILTLTEFRAQTLATDPEDFRNFETFSMAMVDLDYDGDVFRLGKVFWGEELLKEAGGLETAERLALRIPEEQFTGKRMMVILCDRYGNEKALVLAKEDFGKGNGQDKGNGKGGRKTR